MVIWENENKNERIDALTRLVPKKRFAILTLANICREHDGTFSGAETEPGFKPDRHFRSFYLYYEGRRLIGELFIFLTDNDRAEITAIVDPCCRKQGVFKKLLGAAEEELDKYGISDRYFVAEPECEDAKKVIEHFKLTTDHYEHIMEFTGKESEMPAGEGDNKAGILQEYAVSIEKESDGYHAAIKKVSETDEIGTANACITGKSVFIYGVEISENYRRQGLGRKLITEMIGKIREDLPENAIKLQVSSENIPAVGLYKGIGFEIVSSLAYIKALKIERE